MIDKSAFVNHFDFTEYAQTILSGHYFDGTWGSWCNVWDVESAPDDLLSSQQFYHLSNLIPAGNLSILTNQLRQNSWLAVGLDGKSDHFYDTIGNYRLSNYNQAFADLLWRRLVDAGMMKTRTQGDELDDGSMWRPIGVSPLFRYIRYKEGGQLVAHYDQTYQQDENHRTLMSLVIYLTSNKNGKTRFLKDPQIDVPMTSKDFSDWDRSGNDEEILFGIEPTIGSALLFDHRLLHDSEPLEDGDPEKIIIRTDIMYERIA